MHTVNVNVHDIVHVYAHVTNGSDGGHNSDLAL